MPVLSDDHLEKLQEYMTVMGIETPLYHGTNSETFAAKLSMHRDFSPVDRFVAAYCAKSLGQNVQYGPGIYLTDNKGEALGYGGICLALVIPSDMPYLDLDTRVGTQTLSSHIKREHAIKYQEILAATNLNALIRVKGSYYTLRNGDGVKVRAVRWH